MIKRTIHIFVAVLAIIMSNYTYAAVSNWHIVPDKSNLTFKAIQNNSPVKGSFKVFTGEIKLNLEQLSSSYAHIVVDMNSISTPYKMIKDTLKTPDWLDTKRFPQSTFTTSHIKKINDNVYQVDGNLTIRDKTLPVTIVCTINNYSKNNIGIEGSTHLKRTAFGVGSGEWARTDSVKDDIEVHFLVVLSPGG